MIEPTREDLLTCLRVSRWADELASRAYPSLLSLERAAVSAATPLSSAEVDEALAAHPRIGERRGGADAEARFSAAEQAASASDDAALASRLAEGNRAYEARFDRVFLIRAAGRSREEIVTELERRLLNDDVVELAEVADQLRGIALLRLRATYGEVAA
ncbi:2-oxo-4-hydroxy-4-carboxy-5-ureidoimidazoline decarboxylase [Demequina subtropica]|uniref:2-oxo-4-hydroxy-4-carboxy-5-ureidoimidazoline decarboxylase n=1 Tax=Demequina subtropica TaxID=1638989 RepID=UPI000784C9E9|nr:2-oxo-4-hydroxy-4-carboxy-5-ureidoimidazoline decarboxylase [Demequina subtropica]